MSEFGHNYASAPGMHIDSWGTGPFVLRYRSLSWRFEDSDRFGPALICKNGELRKHPYPQEHDPFWHVHKLWVKQGRRIAENGIDCIYDWEAEEDWVCRCHQRDAQGNLTHVRTHPPNEKRCQDCGAEKYEV